MASKGEKISKSKGNSKVEPRELVKTHSADSIRYWAGTGRLGNDIIFSEETLARGQKLINKLWNVSKFIEMHIYDYNQNKEKFKEEVKEYNSFITGYSFLATGKLNTYTRDEIKEIIIRNNGKYISSVSKNLDYLIVGEKAGSKLSKAEKLGIKILTEDEFIEKLRK